MALRFLESTQDGSLPVINGLITLPSGLTNGYITIFFWLVVGLGPGGLDSGRDPRK